MKRSHLVAAAAVLLVMLGAIGTFRSSPADAEDQGTDRSKLIKFSHRYHIKEAGVACADCHTMAPTSTSSRDTLLPAMATCYTCHDQKTTDCKFCHIGSEPYTDLVKTTETITFNHEYHLDSLGLKCDDCHRGLDSVAYSGPSNFPPMATCYRCHNGGESVRPAKTSEAAPEDTAAFAVRPATDACTACHASTVNLLPPSHRIMDFKKDHKQFTRLGNADDDCRMCHRKDVFCQDCHTNAALGTGASKPTDVYTSRGARTDGVNPANPMTLELVHSLNYRFTHAVDAKGKTADCYTCHDAQSFCAQCHMQDGTITLRNDPKPAWHNAAGFTTGRAVGSGGGLHAVYARRDIESCQSCHDAQGSDPVCITCHNDPDGLRGTDPKTHPAGFMSGDEGSWHTDGGAVCYTCHTDPNAHPGGVRGRGFCGYCHGAE